MKNILKIHEQKRCPECKGNHFDRDTHHGEIICHDCGLVLTDDIIDYGPEWRAFDFEQNENRARTGLPMNELIADKGLSTSICWKNKDHYGKNIPRKNIPQMYRIRKWHQRTRLKRGLESNIQKALQNIMRISSILGLPRSIQENAATIYRKAAYQYLVRGRTIEGMAATAVYAACRQCHIPRSFEEISKASNVSKKELSRNYRFLKKKLKLKLLPANPHDFLNRFSSRLGLSSPTIRTASSLINTIIQEGKTSGCNPASIAAAAIYVSSILCDERKTQEEVAKASGITDVTIRSRYKEICEQLDIDIAI